MTRSASRVHWHVWVRTVSGDEFLRERRYASLREAVQDADRAHLEYPFSHVKVEVVTHEEAYSIGSIPLSETE